MALSIITLSACKNCHFNLFSSNNFREAIEEIIALETESGEIVSYPKLINVLESIQRSKKYKTLLPELEDKIPFRALGKSFLERRQVKNIPMYPETVRARQFYRNLMLRRKENCLENKDVFNEDVIKLIPMDGRVHIMNKMIEKEELETIIVKIEALNAEDTCLGSYLSLSSCFKLSAP